MTIQPISFIPVRTMSDEDSPVSSSSSFFSPIPRSPTPVADEQNDIFDMIRCNNLTEVKKCQRELNFNVDQYDMMERTLLMHAAAHGSNDVFQFLVEKEAALHLKDMENQTALTFAAGHPNGCNMIPLLCHCGVDLNTQTRNGTTALMISAEKGYFKNVLPLLIAGADPSLVNEKGKSAAQLTKSYAIQKILKTYQPTSSTPKILFAIPLLKDLIVERRKSPFTGRTQLILRTPGGKVERIYYQTKLDDGKTWVKGRVKTCKIVETYNGPDSIRLVAKNIKVDDAAVLNSIAIAKIFPDTKGLALSDLIIQTFNKRKETTIDFYQKNYRYGDLLNLPTSFKNQFTEEQIKHLIKHLIGNLLQTIKALHEKEIYHCDIKLENILIDFNPETKNFEATLSDFDHVSLDDNDTGIVRGSLSYTSPELARCMYYRKKYERKDQKTSDLWALGMVFYYLWNQQNLPKTLKDLGIFQAIGYTQALALNTKYETAFPEPQKDTIDHLIWQLLLFNPDVRATI